MDLFLVGIITFFAVLIGGIFWWSASGRSTVSGTQHLGLDMSPESIVEMQLEEILESKNAAAPDGQSFKFPFVDRDAYIALKASDSGKPLQSALLKRCIECLQATMTFDARVKIVYESYNNLVPREVLSYLGDVKSLLTSEIESVKGEANLLKAGWGESIFNQAMDLTVGLQKRKEARQQAEEQKVVDAKNKEHQKVLEKRKEEEAILRQQREADKAYKALMGEAAPKQNASNKKDTNTHSQKKTTSQKK